MKRTTFVFILIGLAVLARLLPHPPNFTPVGAIALFSGHALSKRWAYIVPLSIMIISDFFIGYHALIIPVYAALMVNVFIGEKMGKKFALLGAFAGSIVFFISTNFAVWLMYEVHSVATLIECYTLAIPFYQYSLAGDLVYTSVLFGVLVFSENHFPSLRPAYKTPVSCEYN